MATTVRVIETEPVVNDADFAANMETAISGALSSVGTFDVISVEYIDKGRTNVTVTASGVAPETKSVTKTMARITLQT